MLYPKNKASQLDENLFKNPTCEYRGTPFWAWNGKLNKETLAEQIDMLRKMGMGGFHMHVRTGMDSPYLDAEFMDYVRFCVEKAKNDQMLAWLYDEDLRHGRRQGDGRASRVCAARAFVHQRALRARPSQSAQGL